jgi:3D (Asp-Asp-Asp) domain-containing protein
MKTIIILISCLVMSCSYATTNKSPEGEVYTARITYYSTDRKWGNKVACQNSKYAKEGVTVAAHPKFKFGTKIYIPGLKGKLGNGYFVIQDRGSAVTSKKASRGKAYVFDVYVTSHSKIRKFAHSNPEYMRVYVVKP